MKIVIIGPAHPYRGGIADTNESFCQTLVEMGHDASIVTFTVQYPQMFFPGKTQFSTEAKPDGIRITRWINSVNPINWLMTAKKINQGKPHLVIVRYWLPFLAPCLGSIVRMLDQSITSIAMCDNVIPHEKRIGDKIFTKYFINAFKGFITLSNTTFKELDLFTNKPKTYFPHPININLGKKLPELKARQRLNLDPEGKYLLFFGLIRKYKGLDLTIDSMALDKIKELNIKLLIVGEFYDDPDKYKELIKSKGLEKNVVIVNEFVPTSDIKLYFSAADMVIQTYHTASQSGISQISFNFDCPILVTNVGGLSEIVIHEKVGYVCERNPEEIANYILDFYKNNRKNEFSKNIKKEKEKYSWKSFAEEVIKLYLEIETPNSPK
jgi:glycosyltransferase involved in cell wall biosynthesis